MADSDSFPRPTCHPRVRPRARVCDGRAREGDLIGRSPRACGMFYYRVDWLCDLDIDSYNFLSIGHTSVRRWRASLPQLPRCQFRFPKFYPRPTASFVM